MALKLKRLLNHWNENPAKWPQPNARAAAPRCELSISTRTPTMSGHEPRKPELHGVSSKLVRIQEREQQENPDERSASDYSKHCGAPTSSGSTRCTNSAGTAEGT